MDRPHGPDLLDQAFTRAAGASLVAGNSVRLLRDATENYPAWLSAIGNARRYICFENFIYYEDDVGAEFSAALIERARAGVEVRLVYDWLGCLWKASKRFWRPLLAAGVMVRCFNSPRTAYPFSWLQRDHRKLLVVDGEIGFITGLCVGQAWRGYPERNIGPWRDTGVAIQGPALAEIENAFAQVWATSEPRIGAEGSGVDVLAEFEPLREPPPAAGDVALRVVATAPGSLAVLRLDHLIAAAASRTLWITDAYFAGIPPYIQALRSAAIDGVDVRLLVPGASDIGALRPLSQAGYRPLLEAGVRVFEWKGPMLHAKTAVADGRWARVGSSNLNIASWVGNYELDALIEDRDFASQMERMFESDIANSTEIVLRRERRRRGAGAVALLSQGLRRRREDRLPPEAQRGRGLRGERPERSGRGSRAAAGALRLGRTVGAALSEQRVLATAEAKIVAIVAVIALLLAICVVVWPWVAAVPVALLLAWASLVLSLRAFALRRERQRRGLAKAHLERTPGDAGQAPS